MPDHRPYADPALDQLYNLLFAEDTADFSVAATGPLAALLEEPPDAQRLLQIANNSAVESRVRQLAHRRLRHAGGPAPEGNAHLLGVIVEVALADGLDTLAAYIDGSVRCLHHSGALAIVEDPRPLASETDALFAAARPVLSAIGPWEGERLPPPPAGQARLSFLMAGQLYLGQGPLEALAADPVAGPVMGAATDLLGAVGRLTMSDEPARQR